MPEIARQKKSGALIFTPTMDEQAIVGTKQELEKQKAQFKEQSKILDSKIKELDDILREVRKLNP